MFTFSPLRSSLLVVTILLTACGGGGGGGGDAAASAAGPGSSAPGASPAFSLYDIEASPYAIWANEAAHREITVRARATSPEVGLELTYFDELIGGTGNFITRAMFDDGTHGDEHAADGIWTLSFALGISEPARLRLYDGQVDRLSISVGATDADHNRVSPANTIDASVEVALLDPTLQGQVTAEIKDTSLLTTDALINVVDPAFDGQSLSSVTERVYQAFVDDPFDFIVIFNTTATGDGIPRSRGVKNDIEGINLGSYDSSSAYGSAGRLQQVVYQNNSVVGLEVNHEIGHRWGAFLDDPALNLSIPTGFHWGPSDHVGQMGNGPYVQEDANGDYLVTNAEGSEHFISNRFSNLELYLMGLVGPDEVAPLRFVTDPDVTVNFGATLPAASTRPVTIDDIVDVYGQRLPPSETSQNVFAAAFVVVSDQPLSAPEYTLGTVIARYYAGTSVGGQRSGGLFEASDPPSFSASTGFRATLDTHLM